MCKYLNEAIWLYGIDKVENGLLFPQISRVLKNVEKQSDLKESVAYTVYQSGLRKMMRHKYYIDPDSLELFDTDEGAFAGDWVL